MKKMVFLLELVVLCYLLPFYACADKFTLDAHPGKINAISTRNFTLNCTYQSKQNNHVVSLQIWKGTQKGAKPAKRIASLTNESSVHILNRFVDILPDPTYTRRMTGKNKAYLSVRWAIVPEGLGGMYTCIANIIDNVGRIRKMKRSLYVKEEKPGRRQMVAALLELQRFNQRASLVLAKLQASMTLANFMKRKCCMTSSQGGRYRQYVAFTYKPKPLRHSQAGDYCRMQGGYLVEIDNEFEWRILAGFIRYEKEKGYYIAGRQNRANNKIFWARTGRERKKVGKRNLLRKSSKPYCLELWRSINWKINAVVCSKRRSFICEIEAPY